jgi:hypothetical protein
MSGLPAKARDLLPAFRRQKVKALALFFHDQIIKD